MVTMHDDMYTFYMVQYIFIRMNTCTRMTMRDDIGYKVHVCTCSVHIHMMACIHVIMCIQVTNVTNVTMIMYT